MWRPFLNGLYRDLGRSEQRLPMTHEEAVASVAAWYQRRAARVFADRRPDTERSELQRIHPDHGGLVTTITDLPLGITITAYAAATCFLRGEEREAVQPWARW